MHLDEDTCEALGFGDPWEQLALRWPLYVVTRSTRRDWRRGRTTTQQPIESPLTTMQRRRATNDAARGHSHAIIARRLGVSIVAVRRYLTARAA